MLSEFIAYNFCGSTKLLRSNAFDIHGLEWHACTECIRLMRSDDWDNFIERIVRAFTSVRAIPENEQAAFRDELETLYSVREGT